MSTIFFTADLHLGHERIVELSHRPFDTIQQHDLAIYDNWASVVRDDDIVWVLGDLSIEGSWKHALEVMDSLPGRKRLVTGNHDQAWVGKSSSMKYMGEYLKRFEIVTPWARGKIGSTKVILSHFPYKGDHTEADRFDDCRLALVENSKPLIHGHVHSTDRKTVVQTASGRDVVQIHVGMDAWGFRPVASHELEGLL